MKRLQKIISFACVNLFGQVKDQLDEFVSIEQLTLFFNDFKIWPQGRLWYVHISPNRLNSGRVFVCQGEGTLQTIT